MALTDQDIRQSFYDCADFSTRELECCGKQIYVYAIDGLISGGDLAEYVLRPLLEQLRGDSVAELYSSALRTTIYNSVVLPVQDIDDVQMKLVNGFGILLFPGAGALACEVKTGESRGISSPETESTIKGPKDAFNENVRTNTSLIRRHLRSPKLRIYETSVGIHSHTNVALVWLQGITPPCLVQRMKKRLSQIHTDFLTPSAVEESVTGSRATAFPLLQYTERADTFCLALLEGRIGLVVDGLPLGYLAPVDLKYLMDSPEDLSRDYVTASCVRVLRYTALLVSLLLPGIYIALTMFQPEMIPLTLLREMIESKQHVPFPSSLEVIALLAAFELLQESGIHLPQAIGQSVSTVGGIVVGTAAAEAGLISPSALIAVSAAGICGFVLPNRDLAEAIRVWRFAIALMGTAAGLFGVTMGVILLSIHLSGLTSLEEAYLSPFHKSEKTSILRERIGKRKQ